MATEFVRACDRYQLLLFAPLLVFGLRASEPCYLFREYLEPGWLRVPCNPDLGYQTKGKRDKRFPLIEVFHPLWGALRHDGAQGLLYLRRRVIEGGEAVPLRGASLVELVTEFQSRSAKAKSLNAEERRRLRDRVLQEAGGLRYDHVEGEFHRLARQLGWPAQATLKDFRHLFCTTMGNTPMPEGYRRYLMGQAPGKAAAVAYTHLNQLTQQYAAAVRREWAPLVAVVNGRVQELAGGVQECDQQTPRLHISGPACPSRHRNCLNVRSSEPYSADLAKKALSPCRQSSPAPCWIVPVKVPALDLNFNGFCVNIRRASSVNFRPRRSHVRPGAPSLGSLPAKHLPSAEDHRAALRFSRVGRPVVSTT